METVVLQNSAILDCTGRDPYPRGTLIVADKRIQAVGPMDQVPVPRDGRVIDLEGQTIMPGLIDAHAHVALMGGHMGGFEAEYPGAIFPLEVAKNIEDYLVHGFTTIRDAGGCDWSFKLADLIVVDGNSIDDTSVLKKAENIPLVMQPGKIVKTKL